MTRCRTLPDHFMTILVGLSVCMAFISMPLLAQKASLSQQIAVMKALKPELKTVGVLAGSLTDKLTQDLTRAGLGQGITVVIAKPKDPREVVSLYKKMVSERKIQILWLPDAADEVVSGVSIDYLKENTAMDGVGLCVDDKKHIASGALLCVQSEGGKLTAYVNKKIAAVVGAAIPGEGTGISFVSQ